MSAVIVKQRGWKAKFVYMRYCQKIFRKDPKKAGEKKISVSRKKYGGGAHSLHLSTLKPSSSRPFSFNAPPISFLSIPQSPALLATRCQPGGIQSQKLYHEWCIRWKNAFTLASTPPTVVANTVMEKCEGYGDENVLWNREGVGECCLISSRGNASARPELQLMGRKKKISLNIFHKGVMNLCGSPRGAEGRRRSLPTPESVRWRRRRSFAPPFSAGAHRGKTGVPVSHVNNEFLIWAPHEILISGILAHQGEIQNQIRGSWLSGWSARRPI